MTVSVRQERNQHDRHQAYRDRYRVGRRELPLSNGGPRSLGCGNGALYLRDPSALLRLAFA